MNRTIFYSETLKNEIKALYDYVNRDECNMAVVETMLVELHKLLMGLKPTQEAKTNE